MKTTTQPKKRGRPVGSKKKVIDFPEMGTQVMSDQEWEDIEVPTLRRIPSTCKICGKYFKTFDAIGVYNGQDCHSDCYPDKSMSLVNKVTWVLTALNVAILISLVIKNI